MKKYTLYVGLNDKDTKNQIVKTEDAFNIAVQLFVEYTGGATIQEARGIYTHEDGAIVIENTLICTVFDCGIDKIYAVADALKAVLNQEAVIIEKADVNSEYYA